LRKPITAWVLSLKGERSILSTCMPVSVCLLQKVAEVMLHHPDLRAVSLDVEREKISYASAGGAPSAAAMQALKSVVEPFNARDLACDETPARESCPACAQGPTGLVMPAGILCLTLPTGYLLQVETCVTAPRFWRWTQLPWVRVEAREPEIPEVDAWRWPMILAGLCGCFTAAGFYLDHFHMEDRGLVVAAYVAAFAAGSWFPAQEVWERLRERVIDVHFLMLAVAAGAASIGQWWEGAILLFLFSLSGAMEEFAMGRTQREIQSLFKASPKLARRVALDGSETEVSVIELEAGTLIRVRPGELFPTDAEIVSGETSADEAAITGEAMPAEKAPGDAVLGGTMNGWGRVDCRVVRVAAESAVNRIIRLIEKAQSQKAPSQRFTDRFGGSYTKAILGVTALMFFAWWLVLGNAPKQAFYNAMTLLVVASPCALVLSIPSAVLAAIASGARRGVLFRGGMAIETLAGIDRVALDKTGTLTTGNLRVTRVEVVGGGSGDALLAAVAGLEANASHPLAAAIVRDARKKQLGISEVVSFRNEAGHGVTGMMAGVAWKAGRRSFFDGASWAAELPTVGEDATEVLAEGGGLRGRILLQDEVREASRPLFEKLSRLGLKVAMLTGDREEPARHVAEKVGLQEVYAGLKPEQKVRRIQDWVLGGEKVAMVGDGINDAPSLAAATVGVAMGMRGSDAALEQADVILMKDRLENFVLAYDLSRRARAIIRQNLVVSMGVVLVLVVLAFGTWIPLTIGVLCHEGSTVLVVINSLRLLVFSSRQG
jgi:Cd2+/Zn2+-exporting ATPase